MVAYDNPVHMGETPEIRELFAVIDNGHLKIQHLAYHRQRQGNMPRAADHKMPGSLKRLDKDLDLAAANGLPNPAKIIISHQRSLAGFNRLEAFFLDRLFFASPSDGPPEGPILQDDHFGPRLARSPLDGGIHQRGHGIAPAFFTGPQGLNQ